VINKLW